MDIEKLKRCESTGIDQIPVEFIQVGGRMVRSEIHKLIHSIWNKKELPDSGKSQSFYLYVRVYLKKTVVIIEEYDNYELRTKYYPTFFCRR
jgi:hypothetical protein